MKRTIWMVLGALALTGCATLFNLPETEGFRSTGEDGEVQYLHYR